MDAIDKLTSHHVKPSVQRIAIMEYLMSHCTHPTVEEIYSSLSPDMPTLSKTTVYNTLKLLCEHGAAKMLNIDERSTCYDAITQPHGHFLCRECGKVVDLMTPALQQKEVEGMELEGHEVQEIHYYYKGVCKQCREKHCYPDK